MKLEQAAGRPYLGPGLALLLLAAACSCAAPSRQAPEGGSGEHVALRFAWPEGLSLPVESEYRKHTEGGSGDKERSAQGSYRLAVASQPDGLLRIVVQQPRILNMNGRAMPSLAVAQTPELLGSFQVVGLFPPTLVVGADAEIRSLEGLAGAEGLLRDGLDGLGDPRARDQVRAALEARLSPEASAGVAEEVWRLSVAMWEGAELELGEVYETEQESTAVRFAARERAPCPTPAQDRECVRLEARFSLDPEVLLEQYRSQAEGLLDPLGEEASSDAIREASDVTEVEVWTEPDTLLPHRVRIVDQRAVVLSDGRESRRTTERTYRYSYAEP
jgi:hypothetical protein